MELPPVGRSFFFRSWTWLVEFPGFVPRYVWVKGIFGPVARSSHVVPWCWRGRGVLPLVTRVWRLFLLDWWRGRPGTVLAVRCSSAVLVGFVPWRLLPFPGKFVHPFVHVAIALVGVHGDKHHRTWAVIVDVRVGSF